MEIWGRFLWYREEVGQKKEIWRDVIYGCPFSILLSLCVRHDVVNEILDQGERVKFMGKVVSQLR